MVVIHLTHNHERMRESVFQKNPELLKFAKERIVSGSGEFYGALCDLGLDLD